MLILVIESMNLNTLSSQNIPPHVLSSPIGWCLQWFWSYIWWRYKMNVHWFRITKQFGYRLTYVFVGAQLSAAQFIQQSMSYEELHDIVSLLHTLYLVLVPIHITTNSINIPNLLVLEECLNLISLAVLGPISFLLITVVLYTPCANIPNIPPHHKKSTFHHHILHCTKNWLCNPHHQTPSCFIVSLKIRLPSLLWSILPLHNLDKNITTEMAQYMLCHSFPKVWGLLGRTTQPGPTLFFHIIIDSYKQEIQPGMNLVDMLALNTSTNSRTWKKLSTQCGLSSSVHLSHASIFSNLERIM